jgi:serine/threonine protein kinase
MELDETADAEDEPFRPGDACDGRYEIVRQLGAGAMGIVYQARHLTDASMVALKVLNRRAADTRARMLREVHALTEIRHPYVVRVFDSGVSPEGIVWYAMELLSGETLRNEVYRSRGLPLARALRFGVQIAEGVAAAHAAGVIHRDLKPENVFVVQPEDEVRVLDFGTSKSMRQRTPTTDRMRVIGTQAYMPPERLLGHSVDYRSDVYSLGHILYEMVSGVHCFSEGPGPLDLPDFYELGIRQIHAPPIPLTRRKPGTPEDVSDIVQRALAKKPSARQQSMQELASELRGALERLERSAAAVPDADALGKSSSGSADAAKSPLATDDSAWLAILYGAARFASSRQAPSQHERMLLTLAGVDNGERMGMLQHACIAFVRFPEVHDWLRAALSAHSTGNRALQTRAMQIIEPLSLSFSIQHADGTFKVSPNPSGELDPCTEVLVGAALSLPEEERLPRAESALRACGKASRLDRDLVLASLAAFQASESREHVQLRRALFSFLLGSPKKRGVLRPKLLAMIGSKTPIGPVRDANERASGADLPAHMTETPAAMSTTSHPLRNALDRAPSANRINVPLVALVAAVLCSVIAWGGMSLRGKSLSARKGDSVEPFVAAAAPAREPAAREVAQPAPAPTPHSAPIKNPTPATSTPSQAGTDTAAGTASASPLTRSSAAAPSGTAAISPAVPTTKASNATEPMTRALARRWPKDPNPYSAQVPARAASSARPSAVGPVPAKQPSPGPPPRRPKSRLPGSGL